MTTLETETIPEGLDSPDESEEFADDAPYGYLKDGVTPRKKPGRKAGGSNSGGGGSSRSLSNLREPLIQRLIEYVGLPLAAMSPLAFSYWEMRAEKTADSLLIIAARSPRTKKWIERLVTGSATGDLGITGVGIVTAMMIDYGRVEPDNKFTHWLGLDDLYLELYGSFEAQRKAPDMERGLFAETSEN